ncbi:hypothetical protein P171DRAFT_85966 [Karstenula rhodostoma CBS 690.94]|uniref:Uncharacterized protein n=1 Tax=Karstenula rhodostoma CBS 690.94 TaxID=1392251 RepID=A0A9P4U8J5_9PLEO|nr:hypothetical protein P171DRAFT_85966 [Karstenula rhodostoma CBS 690.94]
MQILLIPASSPTALALARVLAAEGHVVHAADAERIWGTAPARYSRAYRRFYGLTGKWSAAELWKAIGDNIDLIIPFGPLPGHFIEGLKARAANIVGETLTHDDSEFQDFVHDNIVNASAEDPSIIKVPASFTVHSRACIAEILSNRESTFSLQPLPCYDTDDEDTLVDVEHAITPSASRYIEPAAPIVLSCSTLDDRTVEAIKRLSMSHTKPYRLIEVAEGGAFYSAHAFTHAGQVRTFVVTNTSATDRDFAIVGTGEPLYDLLYQFTKRLAEVLDGWQSVVANHLSLTFHVQDKITYEDFVRKITVVSCHNDPHASLILLAAVPELRSRLALAYTASTLRERDCAPVQFPTNGNVARAMYSAPLAIYGLTRILFEFRPWRRRWWAALARMAMMCLVWAMNFKEEMWETNDPGPALCFWVVMLVNSLIKIFGQVTGIKWATTRVASLHSKTLASYQIALVAFTLMLDIYRRWVAVLLYPWSRTTQR